MDGLEATFFNFPKSQPGSYGGPLNYVIRDNVDAIVRTKAEILDDYVDRNPLTGRFFYANAYKVHSYIARLIYENSVAQQKLPPHKDAGDVSVNYFSL